MTENELTAARIREVLESKSLTFTEKKMFGGHCFMVDDKMLIGTYKDGIMARIDPQEVDELLERDGAEQMIHGGRPMKGYLMLDNSAYDNDTDLTFWVDRCLVFNPKAKSSKRKG